MNKVVICSCKWYLKAIENLPTITLNNEPLFKNINRFITILYKNVLADSKRKVIVLVLFFFGNYVFVKIKTKHYKNSVITTFSI